MIQNGFGGVLFSMIVAQPLVQSSAPLCLHPAKRANSPPVRLVAAREARIDRGKTDRDDPWSDSIAAIAASADRTAFSGLFAFFAPRVKAYLQKTGAAEAQAEDIAQETMLAVWRKAALFDPGRASAATWIFTIARNLRIDALRRDRRGSAARADEAEAEFLTDDTPAADLQLMSLETQARVRRALESLPGEQLRVIQLSFFEERAHGDIARVLRIPLGTVKSRSRLAMRRLRGLLDEDR